MRFRVWLRALFLLISLTFAAGIIAAQSEGGESGGNNEYTDIPQSRAEDGAFTLGNPDAPVLVIEFADYLCGHCQDYHETISQFIEEYVATGQARFQYRFMPIIDPQFSPLLAMVTECAAAQGAFWSTYDLLYELASSRQLSEDFLTVIAERLSLDVEALAECAGGNQTGSFQYETDYALGEELGVGGTPAIRVQVADGPMGAIRIGETTYDGGGVPLETLQQFVASENPAELVVLVNRLRDDHYLQDNSLVTGEPCRAPCWHGITAGETGWEEALAIIEADEQLIDPRLQNAQSGSGRWAFWGQAGSDRLCCQMATDDGEIVSSLWLWFAPGMTLGEVIALYDNPAYLTGNRYTRDQAYMLLYYPDLFMVVSVFVAGTDTGELSEASELIGVEFLSPADMEQVLTEEPLHVWEGYQSYRYYMAGEFELTPVPQP